MLELYIKSCGGCVRSHVNCVDKVVRANYLLTYMGDRGIDKVEHQLALSDIAAHLENPHSLAIVLVDAALLGCMNPCHAHSVLGCGARCGNHAKVACCSRVVEYEGHFILVTGVDLDAQIVHYEDPAVDSGGNLNAFSFVSCFPNLFCLSSKSLSNFFHGLTCACLQVHVICP